MKHYTFECSSANSTPKHKATLKAQITPKSLTPNHFSTSPRQQDSNVLLNGNMKDTHASGVNGDLKPSCLTVSDCINVVSTETRSLREIFDSPRKHNQYVNVLIHPETTHCNVMMTSNWPKGRHASSKPERGGVSTATASLKSLTEISNESPVSCSPKPAVIPKARESKPELTPNHMTSKEPDLVPREAELRKVARGQRVSKEKTKSTGCLGCFSKKG